MVDQSEVRVTVGDRPCNIISRMTSAISCVPPQSGSGTLNIVVSWSSSYLVHNYNIILNSNRFI